EPHRDRPVVRLLSGSAAGALALRTGEAVVDPVQALYAIGRVHAPGRERANLGERVHAKRRVGFDDSIGSRLDGLVAAADGESDITTGCIELRVLERRCHLFGGGPATGRLDRFLVCRPQPLQRLYKMISTVRDAGVGGATA